MLAGLFEGFYKSSFSCREGGSWHPLRDSRSSLLEFCDGSQSSRQFVPERKITVTKSFFGKLWSDSGYSLKTSTWWPQGSHQATAVSKSEMFDCRDSNNNFKRESGLGDNEESSGLAVSDKGGIIAYLKCLPCDEMAFIWKFQLLIS